MHIYNKREHSSRLEIALVCAFIPLSILLFVAALLTNISGGIILVVFALIWFHFGRMWIKYGGKSGLYNAIGGYIFKKR